MIEDPLYFILDTSFRDELIDEVARWEEQEDIGAEDYFDPQIWSQKQVKILFKRDQNEQILNRKKKQYGEQEILYKLYKAQIRKEKGWIEWNQKMKERRLKYLQKRSEIEAIFQHKKNLQSQNLEMKLATADNRVTIMKLHKDQNIYKMRLTHADRKLRVEKNREVEEQNRQLLRDITSVLNSKQEQDKKQRRKQVIESTVVKVKKHLKKVQEKKSQWYNKKEDEEIQKEMVRLQEQSKLPTIKSDTFLLTEKKKEMAQLYRQERLLRVQDVKECLEEQREEYYNRLKMELLDKQEKAEIAKQHIEKRGPYKYISHKWV